MTIDYASIILEEGNRIVAAYEQDRSARVPWSDRWSVGTVARHVAGTHHVVSDVIRGRPDADFTLFATLASPEKDAPEFGDWFRSGTAALCEQLGSAPADAACWSWYEPGRSVGWWARRMALETLVHRTDVDAALGKAFDVEAEIASDGVDEYLDVFVATSRAANGSPAGPTIWFACTDQDEQWWLDLSQAGSRVVRREPQPSSVGVRCAAGELLSLVWGRRPFSDLPAASISGDPAELERWQELVPPL